MLYVSIFVISEVTIILNHVYSRTLPSCFRFVISFITIIIIIASDRIGNRRGISSSNNRYCGLSTGFWHEILYKGSNECGTESTFVNKFCKTPGGSILLPRLCQKVIGISKIYTSDTCTDGIKLKSCSFVSLQNATFYNN